jgi:sugar lactone lactonase YvrE
VPTVPGVGYRAGIDLGTTFTAAAIWRDGEARPEIVTLGARAAAIPTVVFVDPDGTVLVGEAAEARSSSDASRVAREFKRRLGDPAPFLVGGSPWSPEALLAEVLRAAIARISAQEGGPPTTLTLTHPANWGPYKLEQFRQVPTLANLPFATDFASEPDAAAAHYASIARTPAGSVVAVYDLGGGTFDSTILRVGEDGRPVVLGVPEGIDRLGGIDFDAAVLEHVRANAAHLFEGLDPDDPLVASSFAQLRDSCRQAKETLSEDTQATVVVALPTGVAQVRITRGELEAAITPQIGLTVHAMQRAMAAAGVTADAVDAILLVGGASRMPMVAQAISAALGRPIAVDANPKHAIALGAALDVPASTVPPSAPPPAPEAAPTAPAAPPAPEPEPAAADAPAVAPAEPRGRRRLLLGIGAAVTAVAAVGAYVLFAPDGEPEPLVVATVVGTGEFGSGGDNGPATEASLQFPVGVAVDPDGRTLVADSAAGSIRSVSVDGTISSLASEVSVLDFDVIFVAELQEPTGIAAHADGRIVFIDSGCYVGELGGPDAATLIAGSVPDPDTGLCEDTTIRPSAIAAHPDGRTIVVGDDGRVVAIADDDAHTVEQVTDRTFVFPTAVAVHADGRILVAEEGTRVVEISEDGTVRTIAGSGELVDEVPALEDGSPAIDASLGFISGIATLPDGRVLISDSQAHLVFVVDADGTIATFAGTGRGGFNGDGLEATSTQLFAPQGIAVDADGRVLVADASNSRVRMIG